MEDARQFLLKLKLQVSLPKRNEKLRRHFNKYPKYHQPTIKKHLEERKLINLRYKVEGSIKKTR